MDICTRGLEIQSHLITHFNLLSRLLSPLSPSSIIMCTDLNEDCYWSLYHAHVTKNQSNDWLLQLSGKWTGKEIPTGNRVPEHQGGGVTNGDFRVSHYNYKCSASSTFATHYSKSRQNKKKTTTTKKYNRFASLAKFNKQPKSADAIRNRWSVYGIRSPLLTQDIITNRNAKLRI